ncbi:MAG: hypothetical protein ACK4Z4_15335, partial [Ferrovibrio sp.]
LGSLSGAFIASLMIGLIQTFAIAINYSIGDLLTSVGMARPVQGMLSDLWQVTVAQVGPVVPYLMLVLILIFRPTGLMGTRES